MRPNSRKEFKILEQYKKNRRPAYSDRMFREQARLYHRYLSKLGRLQEKEELREELEDFYGLDDVQ